MDRIEADSTAESRDHENPTPEEVRNFSKKQRIRQNGGGAS